MKTIEEVKNAFLSPVLLTDLADLLRDNDDGFAEAEAKYLLAVDSLRRDPPSGSTPALDEYLAAHKQDILSRMVCAGYLGWRVNLENFRHPIGIDFVHYDTVDYTRDHIIGRFPVNEKADAIISAFLHALPDNCQRLCHDIELYFVHLECAAPKLAHYAGYILANELLPWMEPGYRADTVQTDQFAAETRRYFGFLPL